MPKTILLVEDEPLISMELEDAFAEMGFDVISASSGFDAIDALEKKAPELTAVVTDIKLGNGPNGWHVGHRARELEPSLPILYMSGDSIADWPRLAVPDSEMVAKPFVLEEMVAVVAKLTMPSAAAHGMPRYFFNVVAGGTIIEDHEGTVLPDLDAARDEALKDARALMSAAVLEGWDISGRSVKICGEAGEVLLRVAFTEAIVTHE